MIVPFESFVFNPNNLPVDTLPTIFGFISGTHNNWFYGLLMAEDGTHLGQHTTTNEEQILTELGIIPGSRPDRHVQFKLKYPGGYRMGFVESEYKYTHLKLNAAIQLYIGLHPIPTKLNR